MANFSKWNAKQDPRTELHDVLGLTGAEISINNLPAGAGVPFVHTHKKNEEIYIILSGKGSAVLDGEKVDFAAGDVIRVAPAVKRQRRRRFTCQLGLYSGSGEFPRRVYCRGCCHRIRQDHSHKSVRRRSVMNGAFYVLLEEVTTHDLHL